jgi:hypothetical protein
MRQSNSPKKLTKKQVALLSKKLGIDLNTLPKNYVSIYDYDYSGTSYFLKISCENTCITIDANLITSIVKNSVTTQIKTSVNERVRQTITLWNNVNHILSNTYYI